MEGGWGGGGEGGGGDGVCIWVWYIHCSSVSATMWALFSGSHWESGRWLTRWPPVHLNVILGSYQGAATFHQGLSLQKSHHEDHPHLQVGTHSGSRLVWTSSKANFNVMIRDLRNFLISNIFTSCTSIFSLTPPWPFSKTKSIVHFLNDLSVFFLAMSICICMYHVVGFWEEKLSVCLKKGKNFVTQPHTLSACDETTTD